MIRWPTKINALREAGFYVYELAEILDISLTSVKEWRRNILPSKLEDREAIDELYEIYLSKNVTELNFIGRAEIGLEFLGILPKQV